MSEILQSMLQASSPQAQEQAPGSAASSEAPQGNVDTDFLERFNRLSAKEAAFRKREQEMRAERDSWKSKVERLDRLEKLRAEDPEGALKELGLDYDKLTESRLRGMGSESDRELKQLKDELFNLKTQLQTEKQSAEQEATGRALQQAHADIQQMCDTREDLELIKSFGEYDLVLDTAAEYFKATGKMVTLEEAAKHVESHLEKKLESILAAKKVAARLNKQETPADKESLPFGAVSRAQESERSLSHSMNASSKPSLALSEDDLRQAALRALRGS